MGSHWRNQRISEVHYKRIALDAMWRIDEGRMMVEAPKLSGAIEEHQHQTAHHHHQHTSKREVCLLRCQQMDSKRSFTY